MTDEGRADCTDHYVAYLDVMGFKERVRNAVASGRTRDEIALVKREFDRVREFCAQLAQQLSTDAPLQLYMFSDSICVAIPADKDGAALLAVTGVATVVGGFSLEGLFIRGGVVRGLHYGGDTLIFSPALIEAHRLEDKVAEFPRVIVARDVQERFNEDVGAAFTEHAQAGHVSSELIGYLERRSEFIWQDSDECYFVNYLHCMCAGMPIGLKRRRVSKHRHAVQRNRDEHGSNHRIAAKCDWLDDYHNRHCLSSRRELGDLVVAHE